jgi:hypothetical protein
MMNCHEKSSSAIVAVKPTQGGAIRCGAGGADGGGRGEGGPTAHAPGAVPGTRGTEVLNQQPLYRSTVSSHKPEQRRGSRP